MGETVFFILLSALLLGIIVVIVILLRRKEEDDSTDLVQENAVLNAAKEQLSQSLAELKAEKKLTDQENDRLLGDNSRLQERNDSLNTQLEKERKDLLELQEKFKSEFENLTNAILNRSTERITEKNKEKLQQLLEPLKSDIKKFKDQVAENQEKANTWNTRLSTIISDLSVKNEKLSEDAQALVTALKGESKTQGNWGEFVLERVLTIAGLKEGVEYEREYTTTNAAGDTIRLDALVYLPDKKHLIIDSKVSLKAHMDYSNEEDPDRRKKLLDQHIISIKNHIKLLSEKAYPSGAGLDSPEVVLMFVPVEQGFELAMQHDQDLYDYAYKRNIVIVSAATLLATLKTVASIWKQEKQNRNVQLIAEEASKMVDKFVLFTETMQKIGSAIERASSEYDKGMGQLSEGKGNLVGRAQKIRELGAKGNKELSADLLNDSEDIEIADDEDRS